MLSVLVLTVFLGIINRSIASFECTSTNVYEKLIISKNPILTLNGTDRPTYLMYLMIAEPITKDDDLFTNITVTREDGKQYNSPGNLTLCDLLEKENTNSNSTIYEFRLSSIFNLEGERCPISAGKRILKPYIPPRMLSHDIGCGLLNFTVTLGKCNDMEEPTNCTTYVTTKMSVKVEMNPCSDNDLWFLLEI